MSEPASDDVDLDVGLQKVDRGGVPEDVRADPAAGSRVIQACPVTADDLVDAEAGQGLAAGGEYGRVGR